MQAVTLPDNNTGHAKRPRLFGWLLITPMVLWLVLFVVAPLLILLVYSFCQRDDMGRIVYTFTLDNYQRAFDPIYLRILWRSVLYAAITTVLCIAIGYPVAWFIARQSETIRNRLIMLVMIPFWTSFLIRTYAWITILNQNGLLNGLLESARIIPQPLEILYTPSAVILGLVYAYLPFMILPIYGSAEKVDESLVDAAHDLGAGPMRAFSDVIIPLTWPGISAGILLVFVPAIGMFAVTDLMGGGRDMLIGNVIQNQFGKARNWPFGAALGVIFTVLFVAAYAFVQYRASKRNQHQ
ncbi:spermidine/putrescine transport system permease protein [Ereboglobus sp. PH5-5]|uniref:ABC transporter permease n=1 Tax=unclassified Ereboglobus TaxID=2626932 RepID=UPI00240617B9|nr:MULTISPECIES: ABC transporter permease [unclassified Ereboglobus]MDF9826686.1 spermidine/putrescine transport system permease protein [Ereboglobus sp. PH5-10]MDF9833426.1 spermidine/putrescine transport system permease protein [Ereboglobus sp. PH5-5]